jgi:hypothetical protein
MPTFRELLEHISAAEPAGAGPGYVLRRMNPDGELDLYVGKETPSGLPVLRLKIPERSRAVMVEGLSTSCVAVERRKLPDDGPHESSLLVKLRDRNYLDHYCLVVDDFLKTVVPVTDSVAAWRLLSARLRSWLRFFSEDFTKMSEERQRGLIGELTVLCWLASARSWPDAVASWTGPDADDRDFRLERVAIEVKARLAGDRDVVRISNEHQLEVEPRLSLYLWVVTLQEDATAGGSLVDWVRQVRSKVSENAPGSLVRLEELLQKAGFSDVHFDGLPVKAYAAVGQRVFRVARSMPRIVASQLPQGVRRVAYDLDLTACADQRVEERSIVV